jgi:hypothetical protein
MSQDPQPDTARLQRELEYYQRELNVLGARYRRSTEEQSQAFREAERSRAVVRLVREIYRLAEHGATPASIIISTLTIVSSSALADRAVLLREDPIGSGAFQLMQAIGFGEDKVPSKLSLTRPPDFAFTAGDGPGRMEINAKAMAGFLGVPFILWTFDKPTGFAILVGNRQEGNTNRPYEEGDRELIDTSLTVFLDALARKQGPRMITPSAMSAVASIPHGVVRRESGLSLSDLQEQLKGGGRITGVVVVERPDGAATRYVPYFATTWRHGYSVMKAHDNKSDRTYKDLVRLMQLLRVEFAYAGAVTIYASGVTELQAIPGIKTEDLAPGAENPN